MEKVTTKKLIFGTQSHCYSNETHREMVIGQNINAEHRKRDKNLLYSCSITGFIEYLTVQYRLHFLFLANESTSPLVVLCFIQDALENCVSISFGIII